MTPPSIPSSTQRELLEFARAYMGEIDGQPVTTLQGILRAMRSMMREKPEYGKLLFQTIMQASKEEEAFNTLLLNNALSYKDHWGPRFALARKMGRAEPDVYPHPDDIITKSDGSVRIDGPLTKYDAMKLNDLIEARDKLFEVVQFVLDEGSSSADRLRPLWLKARRYYYRVSPQIPKRLKRPFPKFNPKIWSDDDPLD
ncbi:MAG: hypothetical protein AAF697_12700 [Pseudomonadota bacterium]